jgi:hypothetical protein
MPAVLLLGISPEVVQLTIVELAVEAKLVQARASCSGDRDIR